GKLAGGVAELLAAAKNSKDSALRLLLPPTVLYIGHMPVYCMAAVSVEPGCQHIKGTPVGLILKQTDCLLIVVVLEKDAQNASPTGTEQQHSCDVPYSSWHLSPCPLTVCNTYTCFLDVCVGH
ncbi:hypothetical protein EMCRGX_G016804, partial [Ephydatia muelleri]